MTIADFRDWEKQGCPFEKGVELYRHAGGSTAILKVLAMGENGYSKGKLYEALKRVSSEIKEPPENGVEKKTDGRGGFDPNQTKEGGIIERVLSEIDRDLKRSYQNQSNLHSQLKRSKSENSRKNIAREILKLSRYILNVQAKRRYIENTNSLPPEVKHITLEDIDDRAHLKQRQLANRVYISKHKKSTDKDRVEEVDRRQEENKEIEKLLSDGSNTAE